MSIAVAVRTERALVVATDSQTTFGSRRVSADNHEASKVRKIGTSLMAGTGWAAYDNILDDVIARRTPNLSNSRAIFSFFTRLWRELHDRYQFVNDQCAEADSPFGDLDSTFLIANRRGIYAVESDLSVTEFRTYYAIGSGSSYALGALHVLYDRRGDAEAIARAAAESAIAFDTHCGGEVCIEKVAQPKRPRRR